MDRLCVSRKDLQDYYPYDGCDWCGQKLARMYIYGSVPRFPMMPRVFCNKDCYKSFME